MRYATLPALLVVVLFMTSCATSPKKNLPEPRPMPASASFDGVWFSPQFEDMYLRQTGNMVTGIFTFKSGGKITGTVEGNLLTFEWIQPGDKQQARRTLKGHGYLQLSVLEDQKRLLGKWGYDASYDDGGPWNASFTRNLEEGDPTTLEKWNGGY